MKVDGRIAGLVVDEAEAAMIRDVAARIIDGEGLYSIALDLERRGVQTLSGGQWSRLSVLRLIKPAVAGLREHNGEELPGSWEPILSREVYDAAKRAATPGAGSLPAGHNARKHLLSGIAICGLCGVGMTGKSSDNGRYECSTHNTRNGVRGCGKVGRQMIALDAHVTELLLRFLEAEDVKAVAPVMDEWADDITAAEAEVQAVQSAYEAGDIAVSDWVRGLKVARQRLTVAQDGRAGAMTEALGRASDDSISGADARARWELLNLSQRRAALKRRMEAVVVQPAGRGRRPFNPGLVEIVWR